ncbi:unnamed protein product, partial [Ectocarpus fasciculatus]
GRNGGRGGAWDSAGRRPTSRPAKSYVCKRCGGNDHWWLDCPLKNVPKQNHVCLNCGNPGHFRQYCPFLQGQGPGGSGVGHYGPASAPPPPPRPDLPYGAPPGDLQGIGMMAPPPPLVP